MYVSYWTAENSKTGLSWTSQELSYSFCQRLVSEGWERGTIIVKTQYIPQVPQSPFSRIWNKNDCQHSKARSKHVKGSKEHYLLGQNTNRNSDQSQPWVAKALYHSPISRTQKHWWLIFNALKKWLSKLQDVQAFSRTVTTLNGPHREGQWVP